MNFFKVRNFRRLQRPNPQLESEVQIEQVKNLNVEVVKSFKPDPLTEIKYENDIDDDGDDDDFFLNEVKRKLRELRKNSFMMLIPEDSTLEDDDYEGETSCSETDGIYEQYCERMLFFDRMLGQQLKEVGSQTPLTPTKRSRFASMKLTSTFGCFFLTKFKQPEDEEIEKLQHITNNDPYEDLETAYVAQICLTWEVLRFQFSELRHNDSCKMGFPTCYSRCAQMFQQFQVLLQRFIENEPFEEGRRVEIYARARTFLPKLLQVPIIQGYKTSENEEMDILVGPSDLIKIIEGSIIDFLAFLKMEKIKPKSVVSNLFGGQNQTATSLQMIRHSLDKKNMKLKELKKKKRGGKNKWRWPQCHEEVDLFLCLVDVKIVSRVLRMSTITKEQLVWCENKINSLNLSEGDPEINTHRLPLFFPY